MKGLKDTLTELAGFRKTFEKLTAATMGNGVVPPGSRLVGVDGFGSNPGNLRMLSYAPSALPSAPALVVALHGCTQSAAAYDYGSAWSALADAFGFAVLFPEQQTVNNPNRCFNWFLDSDTQRGQGEAHSIHEMIERMAKDHGVDRSRIFVVGLSAGGAMASAMLASYPDVFAGGAIVAGLPYRAATNMQTAFEAMAGKHKRSDREWGTLVRAASDHKGPWPKISIWHGTADAIVSPANMEHSISQWTSVHGAATIPDLEDNLNGHSRRIWQEDGEDIIEAISVAGMEHGVPLAAGAGGWGHVTPFHIEVGLSSSLHILKFWNLAEPSRVTDVEDDGVRRMPRQSIVSRSEYAGAQPASARLAPGSDAHSPSSVITAALAAAGLLKPNGKPSPKDPSGIIAATLRSVGLLKD